MRRKILLSVVALALIAAALTWQFTFAQAVKYSLHTFCKSSFNGCLQVDDMQLDRKSFVLHRPRVETGDGRGGGGLFAEAEKIVFDYAFHPWSLTLDVDVTIDQPNLEIGAHTDIPALIQKIKEQNSLLNIRPNIRMNQGKIVIHETQDLSQQRHTLYINCALNCREEYDGHIAMNFEGPEEERNSLSLSVRRNEEASFELEANLKQLDLATITRTMNQLHPSLKKWSIAQGFADGHVVVSRTHGKRMKAEGGAFLRDVVLNQTDCDFRARFGSLALEFLGKDSPDKRTLGTLSIGGESDLAFLQEGNPIWQLKNIAGGMRIEKHGNAKLKLSGDCSHKESDFGLQLRGAVQLFDDVQTFLNLSLETLHSDKNNALLEVNVKQINDIWNSAEFSVQRFGYREVQFIQEAMTRASKKSADYLVHNGAMDGEGIAYFKGSLLHTIKINKLETRGLVFDYFPYEISGSVGKIAGGGSINFTDEDFARGLNTDFAIEKGMLQFVGTDQALWQLSDINTNISFRDGTIQRSIVNGSFAGLQGTIEVDWLSPSDIIKVNFSGSLAGLHPLLPRRIQRGLQEKFANDHVAFNASLQNLEKGFHAEGIIEVQDLEGPKQEDIAFGFDIERLHPHIWHRSKPIDTEGLRWRRLGDQVLHAVMPALALPLLAVDSHRQKKEEGISGFIVRNGWLYAEGVPLEKYVAPFAFQSEEETGVGEPSITLTGRGNFHGAFDHTGLSISYKAWDVVLDSKNFRIGIDSIEQPLEDKTLAVHYIDFASGMHFGKIPILHGTYLDKNTGLLFNEVDTIMKLEGKQLHAAAIECFCQGIFFAGDINVDMSLPEKDAYDVEIIAHTMSGKVSQVRSFLSQCGNAEAQPDFPLEGDMMFRGDGGYLSFAIRPEETTTNMRVEAALSGGVISFAPLDLSLRELGMNLDYDQQKNRCVFSNIQGALLVGKPGHVDEYLFSGDQLAFSDCARCVGNFDLWVGDKKRDIVRLVGGVQGDSQGQRVKFELDKNLSHFGDVHPSNFSLVLKGWKEIENFELDLQLQLATLYGDLKRVSRSGLFFFPEELFVPADNLEKAKGEFSISMNYGSAKDAFLFNIVGKEIEWNSSVYNTLQLNGSVKDHIWSIDQFRVDDLSLAAELNRQADRWKINFLGLKKGESVVVGLEGEYLDDAHLLNAKVNLLEISLEHLKELSYCEEFASAYFPRGKLKGSGELRIEKQMHKFQYDGFFSMNAHGVQMKGISFADANDFSVHLISERGLNIRNIATKILPGLDGCPPINLQVEKIALGLHKDSQDYEGVRLNIPSRSLNWFAEEVHKIYPDAVSDESRDIIANLKKSGAVDTTLNIYCNGDGSSSFELALEDDTYRFADADHDVRDFTMQLNPRQFSMKTLYHFHNKTFWVHYLQPDREQQKGDIVFFDEKPKENESLIVKWETHPLHGFHICKAKGSFGGIQLNLEKDSQYAPDAHYSYLLGTAKYSIPKSLPFFTDDAMNSFMEQKIGGDVLFDGKIAVSKKATLPHKAKGGIESRDFGFRGYRFKQLTADVDYRSDFVRLTDVNLQDQAGCVAMPEVAFTALQDDSWWMNIPKTYVKKMRPSHLQEVDKPLQVDPLKTLIFNAIEISSLRGKLNDAASWMGTGLLKFSNPPRTNLQHTILALPHEIIMRLGLNPTVLTPVTGTIFFDISDRKVNFTKFKDIYSESKGSKFYLAGPPSTSYVDFDGNLNVNIRMKQYNLLFKLAELFIVSVKGNVQKPVYSLKQERSRNSKKM